MNWTEYFLKIAEQIKLKSKDESTQIGAVIVGKDNEILSTGYNSFPRGLDDSKKERQERPEKYFWIEHAERNAVYNAARIGVSLKNSTIYLTS
jgi:dCMP deaminase